MKLRVYSADQLIHVFHHIPKVFIWIRLESIPVTPSVGIWSRVERAVSKGHRIVDEKGTNLVSLNEIIDVVGVEIRTVFTFVVGEVFPICLDTRIREP